VRTVALLGIAQLVVEPRLSVLADTFGLWIFRLHPMCPAPL
jgi:hypothetical protein